MTTPTKNIHPIDTHVGQRLRNRRAAMGLTQTHVAEKLGISFQQIQKYEQGRNRISASKLFDVAQILEVEVAYFFEGLDQPKADALAPQTAQETLVLTLFRGRTPDTRDAIIRILQAAEAA